MTYTDTFPIVMAYGGECQPWPKGKGANVGSGFSLTIQDNRNEIPGHSDFTLHGQIYGFRGGRAAGNPPSNRGGNEGAAQWLMSQGFRGEASGILFDVEGGEFFAHSDNLASLVQLVFALRNSINPECDEPIAQSGGRDLSVTRGSHRNTLIANWADDERDSHTEAWAAMLKREEAADPQPPTLKYRITIEVEIPNQGNGPEKIGNIGRMINKAAWQGADAYYGSVTVTDESVS